MKIEPKDQIELQHKHSCSMHETYTLAAAAVFTCQCLVAPSTPTYVTN